MQKDMTISVLPKGIALGPALDRTQAEAIYARGKEAVIFAILEMAKQLAEARNPASTTPSTPSGMIPVYEKPAVSAAEKAAWAQKRASWQRSAAAGADRPPRGTSASLLSALSGPFEANAGNPHAIRGGYSRESASGGHRTHDSSRLVPKVQEACRSAGARRPAGARLGNRAVVLSAWMHYGLGTTLQQIVDVFNHHLQMKVTKGGLVQAWYRLQDVFFAWYEQIRQEGLSSAVLHGDETGWRVNGKTHWLWCFSNERLTYYLIDRSRGEPALRKFFAEEFKGTLISDFWALTTRLPAVPDKNAWCICSATWNMWKNTKIPENIGWNSPKSCGDCWATPSVCGSARSVPGGIRIAAGMPGQTIAGTDRNRLARSASQTFDQTAAPTSKRVVHFFGSRKCSLREQPCRTSHSPGSDHSQKQLCQSQPAWIGHPSRADEHLSHIETTRIRSPGFHHSSLKNIFDHWQTSTITTINTTKN